MNLRNVIENIKSQDSRGKSSNKGKSSQNLQSSQGSLKVSNAPRKLNLKSKIDLPSEESVDAVKNLQAILPSSGKGKGSKGQSDLMSQVRENDSKAEDAPVTVSITKKRQTESSLKITKKSSSQAEKDDQIAAQRGCLPPPGIEPQDMPLRKPNLVLRSKNEQVQLKKVLGSMSKPSNQNMLSSLKGSQNPQQTPEKSKKSEIHDSNKAVTTKQSSQKEGLIAKQPPKASNSAPKEAQVKSSSQPKRAVDAAKGLSQNVDQKERVNNIQKPKNSEKSKAQKQQVKDVKDKVKEPKAASKSEAKPGAESKKPAAAEPPKKSIAQVSKQPPKDQKQTLTQPNSQQASKSTKSTQFKKPEKSTPSKTQQKQSALQSTSQPKAKVSRSVDASKSQVSAASDSKQSKDQAPLASERSAAIKGPEKDKLQKLSQKSNQVNQELIEPKKIEFEQHNQKDPQSAPTTRTTGRTNPKDKQVDQNSEDSKQSCPTLPPKHQDIIAKQRELQGQPLLIQERAVCADPVKDCPDISKVNFSNLQKLKKAEIFEILINLGHNVLALEGASRWDLSETLRQEIRRHQREQELKEIQLEEQRLKELEEQAAKEQADKEAKEQEEKAAREQEEKAARELEEKAARELQEKVARELEEKAAREAYEASLKKQQQLAEQMNSNVVKSTARKQDTKKQLSSIQESSVGSLAAKEDKDVEMKDQVEQSLRQKQTKLAQNSKNSNGKQPGPNNKIKIQSDLNQIKTKIKDGKIGPQQDTLKQLKSSYISTHSKAKQDQQEARIPKVDIKPKRNKSHKQSNQDGHSQSQSQMDLQKPRKDLIISKQDSPQNSQIYNQEMVPYLQTQDKVRDKHSHSKQKYRAPQSQSQVAPSSDKVQLTPKVDCIQVQWIVLKRFITSSKVVLNQIQDFMAKVQSTYLDHILAYKDTKLSSVFEEYFEQVQILNKKALPRSLIQLHQTTQEKKKVEYTEIDDNLNQQIFKYTSQTQTIFIEVLASFVLGQQPCPKSETHSQKLMNDFFKKQDQEMGLIDSKVYKKGESQKQEFNYISMRHCLKRIYKACQIQLDDFQWKNGPYRESQFAAASMAHVESERNNLENGNQSMTSRGNMGEFLTNEELIAQTVKYRTQLLKEVIEIEQICKQYLSIFKKNFFDIFEMQHQQVVSMCIFDNLNFQAQLQMVFKNTKAQNEFLNKIKSQYLRYFSYQAYDHQFSDYLMATQRENKAQMCSVINQFFTQDEQLNLQNENHMLIWLMEVGNTIDGVTIASKFLKDLEDQRVQQIRDEESAFNAFQLESDGDQADKHKISMNFQAYLNSWKSRKCHNCMVYILDAGKAVTCVNLINTVNPCYNLYCQDCVINFMMEKHHFEEDEMFDDIRGEVDPDKKDDKLAQEDEDRDQEASEDGRSFKTTTQQEMEQKKLKHKLWLKAIQNILFACPCCQGYCLSDQRSQKPDKEFSQYSVCNFYHDLENNPKSFLKRDVYLFKIIGNKKAFQFAKIIGMNKVKNLHKIEVLSNSQNYMIKLGKEELFFSNSVKKNTKVFDVIERQGFELDIQFQILKQIKDFKQFDTHTLFERYLSFIQRCEHQKKLTLSDGLIIPKFSFTQAGQTSRGSFLLCHREYYKRYDSQIFEPLENVSKESLFWNQQMVDTHEPQQITQNLRKTQFKVNAEILSDGKLSHSDENFLNFQEKKYDKQRDHTMQSDSPRASMIIQTQSYGEKRSKKAKLRSHSQSSGQRSLIDIKDSKPRLMKPVNPSVQIDSSEKKFGDNLKIKTPREKDHDESKAEAMNQPRASRRSNLINYKLMNEKGIYSAKLKSKTSPQESNRPRLKEEQELIMQPQEMIKELRDGKIFQNYNAMMSHKGLQRHQENVNALAPSLNDEQISINYIQNQIDQMDQQNFADQSKSQIDSYMPQQLNNFFDNDPQRDLHPNRIESVVGQKFVPPPDVSEGYKMILQKNFELASANYQDGEKITLLINKNVFKIEKTDVNDESKSKVVDCLHLAAAEEERLNRLANRDNSQQQISDGNYIADQMNLENYYRNLDAYGNTINDQNYHFFKSYQEAQFMNDREEESREIAFNIPSDYSAPFLQSGSVSQNDNFALNMPPQRDEQEKFFRDYSGSVDNRDHENEYGAQIVDDYDNKAVSRDERKSKSVQDNSEYEDQFIDDDDRLNDSKYQLREINDSAKKSQLYSARKSRMGADRDLRIEELDQRHMQRRQRTQGKAKFVFQPNIQTQVEEGFYDDWPEDILKEYKIKTKRTQKQGKISEDNGLQFFIQPQQEKDSEADRKEEPEPQDFKHSQDSPVNANESKQKLEIDEEVTAQRQAEIKQKFFVKRFIRSDKLVKDCKQSKQVAINAPQELVNLFIYIYRKDKNLWRRALVKQHTPEENDKSKLLFKVEYQDSKLTVRVQDLKDAEFFIDQTCESNLPNAKGINLIEKFIDKQSDQKSGLSSTKNQPLNELEIRKKQESVNKILNYNLFNNKNRVKKLLQQWGCQATDHKKDVPIFAESNQSEKSSQLVGQKRPVMSETGAPQGSMNQSIISDKPKQSLREQKLLEKTILKRNNLAQYNLNKKLSKELNQKNAAEIQQQSKKILAETRTNPKLNEGKNVIDLDDEKSLSINSQEIKKIEEVEMDQNSQRSIAIDIRNIGGPSKKQRVAQKNYVDVIDEVTPEKRREAREEVDSKQKQGEKEDSEEVESGVRHNERSHGSGQNGTQIINNMNITSNINITNVIQYQKAPHNSANPERSQGPRANQPEQSMRAQSSDQRVNKSDLDLAREQAQSSAQDNNTRHKQSDQSLWALQNQPIDQPGNEHQQLEEGTDLDKDGESIGDPKEHWIKNMKLKMISKSKELVKAQKILKFYHQEIPGDPNDLSNTIDFTEQTRQKKQDFVHEPLPLLVSADQQSKIFSQIQQQQEQMEKDPKFQTIEQIQRFKINRLIQQIQQRNAQEALAKNQEQATQNNNILLGEQRNDFQQQQQAQIINKQSGLEGFVNQKQVVNRKEQITQLGPQNFNMNSVRMAQEMSQQNQSMLGTGELQNQNTSMNPLQQAQQVETEYDTREKGQIMNEQFDLGLNQQTQEFIRLNLQRQKQIQAMKQLQLLQSQKFDAQLVKSQQQQFPQNQNVYQQNLNGIQGKQPPLGNQIQSFPQNFHNQGFGNPEIQQFQNPHQQQILFQLKQLRELQYLQRLQQYKQLQAQQVQQIQAQRKQAADAQVMENEIQEKQESEKVNEQGNAPDKSEENQIVQKPSSCSQSNSKGLDIMIDNGPQPTTPCGCEVENLKTPSAQEKQGDEECQILSQNITQEDDFLNILTQFIKFQAMEDLDEMTQQIQAQPSAEQLEDADFESQLRAKYDHKQDSIQQVSQAKQNLFLEKVQEVIDQVDAVKQLWPTACSDLPQELEVSQMFKTLEEAVQFLESGFQNEKKLEEDLISFMEIYSKDHNPLEEQLLNSNNNYGLSENELIEGSISSQTQPLKQESSNTTDMPLNMSASLDQNYINQNAIKAQQFFDNKIKDLDAKSQIDDMEDSNSQEINPYGLLSQLDNQAVQKKAKLKFPSLFSHIQKLFKLKNPFIQAKRLQYFLNKFYSNYIVNKMYKKCKCGICGRMEYPFLIRYDIDSSTLGDRHQEMLNKLVQFDDQQVNTSFLCTVFSQEKSDFTLRNEQCAQMIKTMPNNAIFDRIVEKEREKVMKAEDERPEGMLPPLSNVLNIDIKDEFHVDQNDANFDKQLQYQLQRHRVKMEEEDFESNDDSYNSRKFNKDKQDLEIEYSHLRDMQRLLNKMKMQKIERFTNKKKRYEKRRNKQQQKWDLINNRHYIKDVFGSIFTNQIRPNQYHDLYNMQMVGNQFNDNQLRYLKMKLRDNQQWVPVDQAPDGMEQFTGFMDGDIDQNYRHDPNEFFTGQEQFEFNNGNPYEMNIVDFQNQFGDQHQFFQSDEQNQQELFDQQNQPELFQTHEQMLHYMPESFEIFNGEQQFAPQYLINLQGLNDQNLEQEEGQIQNEFQMERSDNHVQQTDINTLKQILTHSLSKFQQQSEEPQIQEISDQAERTRNEQIEKP